MMTTAELIRHLEADHAVTCPPLSPSWGIRIHQVAVLHMGAHDASVHGDVGHTHPPSRHPSATYHPRFPNEVTGGLF